MTTSDNLAHARQAFDAWRHQRSGQPKIPDQLWTMAVALLDEYRISHVARERRFNQSPLR